MEQFSLKNQIEKVIRGENTLFLNPNEVKYVQNALNKKNIDYKIFKPYIESEKNIIYTSNIGVSLIEIKTSSILTHREILGALFSHNINDSFFGEIVISDKYYILVLEALKNYLIENLNYIGNKKVELVEADLESISNYKLKFKSIKLNVNSLRIDNIISKLIPTSRAVANELIKDKMVILNYELLKSKVVLLKEGDVFSIRKIGKFKLINIQLNKNNKYTLEINKYI